MPAMKYHLLNQLLETYITRRPVSEKDPAPDTPGYLVQYTDGYLSWSPKDIFDESHFDSDGFLDALDKMEDLYYEID